MRTKVCRSIVSANGRHLIKDVGRQGRRWPHSARLRTIYDCDLDGGGDRKGSYRVLPTDGVLVKEEGKTMVAVLTYN